MKTKKLKQIRYDTYEFVDNWFHRENYVNSEVSDMQSQMQQDLEDLIIKHAKDEKN